MTAEQGCHDTYSEFLLQNRRFFTGDPALDFEVEEIGIGIDSLVYQSVDGSSVLKIYRGSSEHFMTPQKLGLYMYTTNLASAHFKLNPQNIRIPKLDRDFKVEVNPYTCILQSSEFNCTVGVCPYVPWLRLSELEFSKDEHRVLNRILKNLSGEMNMLFGVVGIQLLGVNIRIAETQSGDRIACITDLCSEISRLKAV